MKITFAATLVSVVALGSSAHATTADYVLFHKPAGQVLRDTKFGPIADFQRSLLKAAQHCSIPVPAASQFADGVFGASSALVVREVAACQHLVLADPSGQTVTAGMWRAITVNVPLPTAQQRARAMSFKFEGTDYDKVEWNVGTSDAGIITWGPLGATAGQAFQVQRILANVDHEYPDLISTAFQTETGAVRNFMKRRSTESATTFIQEVSIDRRRKAIWTAGFLSLGSDKRARDTYDVLMDASSTAGIPEAIADFTRAYWKLCWIPTEADYGFFFDRAIQINVKNALTQTASGYVEIAQQRIGHKFSPAERRRAFAANYTPSALQWVRDRLGRDVAYYLDGVGESALTDASLWRMRTTPLPRPPGLYGEFAAWKSRSGLRASDYGLSDGRIIPPPESMMSQMPVCVEAAYAVLSANQSP